MNIHEKAKLHLGNSWLQQIGYRPEWSNDEFLEAVNREQPSNEARESIIFALKWHGEQLIAEGEALLAEGEATLHNDNFAA